METAYVVLFLSLMVAAKVEVDLNLLTIKNHSRRFDFQRVRVYTPQKLENCLAEAPIIIMLVLPRSANNSAMVSGHITVGEEISGDIEFVVENSRCTIDMKICETYRDFKTTKFCSNLKEKDEFYSHILNAVHPRIECPIQPGNYTFEDTVFDLGFAKFFPIDGHVFIQKYKLAELNKANKTKRTVMCLYFRVKVQAVNKKS